MKYIVPIMTLLFFNPLMMIWLAFYIGSYLDITSWYGFPYILTSIIVIIFSGFVDGVIIKAIDEYLGL